MTLQAGNTSVLLTRQNMYIYQAQLNDIGVDKSQLDLSTYIGQPITQVQQIINTFRLMKCAKKAKPHKTTCQLNQYMLKYTRK